MPVLLGAALCAGWLPAAFPSGFAGPEKWAIRLIPLPRELAIQGSVTAAMDNIALIPGVSTGAPMEEARRLMSDFARGLPRDGTAVRIEMRLAAADEALAGLPQPPNRAQAYSILSAETNGILEVRLTAPASAGLLYAARTLHQLVLPRGAIPADGAVEIPAGMITDWPDLEERGFWGPLTADPGFLRWMAEFKLNLGVGMGCRYGVDTNGAAWINYDREIFDLAARNAISPVPYITHFDAQKYTGVYEAYPAAQGVSAAPSPKPVPNLGNPDYRRIYHDWMRKLAAIPGVRKIDAWLSEGRHFDARTLALFPGVPGHVLETRLIKEAGAAARQINPELQLRVMLTQGAFDNYAGILSEIPPDIGVLYYHGTYRSVCPGTYSQTRRKIIIPALERYAAEGGWLGVVPALANLSMDGSWSCPQFVQYRLAEFHAKKLRNVTAFATPNLAVRELSFMALAEWAWNAEGRSAREFAKAWAFRRGFDNPDLAADWVDAIGPVNWDLAAAGVPGPRLDDAANRLARRPLTFPELFQGFRDLQHADANLRLGGQSRGLADAIGDQAIIAETLYTQGYMQLVRELGWLGSISTNIGDIAEDRRADIAASLQRLAAAAGQITAAAQTQQGILSDKDAPLRGRWLDPLVNAERLAASTIRDFADLAPASRNLLPGLWQPAGSWNRELLTGQAQRPADAAGAGYYSARFGGDAARIIRANAEWDITDQTTGAGRYIFLFRATAGTPLLIRGVTLQEVDHAGRRRTISGDDHQGYAARLHTQAPFYKLDLPGRPPDGARYLLAADVLGCLPSSTSSWENTKGIIYIKQAPSN